MSSRSDSYYARRYDEDEQWYNNFVSGLYKSPTNKQMATIKIIENRNPCNPKFIGLSINDASDYISEYGRS